MNKRLCKSDRNALNRFFRESLHSMAKRRAKKRVKSIEKEFIEYKTGWCRYARNIGDKRHLSLDDYFEYLDYAAEDYCPCFGIPDYAVPKHMRWPYWK